MFQTCFPFTTIWDCHCVKLCSFNDPCGETTVAAASSNKKEEEQRVKQKIRKEKMDVMNTALLTFSTNILSRKYVNEIYKTRLEFSHEWQNSSTRNH